MLRYWTCSTEVLHHLGTSDHSLMFVTVDAKLKTSSDVLFHRTIYCHHKDVFGIASDPSLQKQLSSKAGFEGWPLLFLSAISLVLKALFLTEKYQQKPNNQLWFILMMWPWSTVIFTTISIRGNSVAEPLPHSELHVVTESWKDAKSSGSPNKNREKHLEFWKKAIISRLLIINILEVISFSSNKTKHFTSTCRLDDKHYVLLDFCHLMLHKLCDTSISAWEECRLLKSLSWVTTYLLWSLYWLLDEGVSLTSFRKSITHAEISLLY